MPPACRLCAKPLTQTFCDLGRSPLANSFLAEADLAHAEPLFPLHVRVCEHCFLVQLPEVETPQNIFSDYAYFSSFADGWVEHCRVFANTAVARFGLTSRQRVVEIASNDGCMLNAFKGHGVEILGVEPAANVAQTAIVRGIPTRIGFFGAAMARELAAENLAADLIVATNVLAHVPDLNDFVHGLSLLLKADGVLSVEFPSLLRMIEETQFDTIYHEHYSYFSLMTAERALNQHGLSVFDVEDLTTHGGSLRIYAQPAASKRHAVSARVADVRRREADAGLDSPAVYREFGQRVNQRKSELLRFLEETRRAGKSIVAYGAPAKGNTLLNSCGIGRDLLDYTVDRSPHKQGRFLPGSRLPIRHPDAVRQTRPDFVLILPWNWQAEIIAEFAYIREWGGRFVVPVPTVQVIT
jgi:predicted TPR repeat methyltransferase